MAFDDELIATRQEFLDTFGESVTVTTPDGEERAILAIIDRQPPAELMLGHADSILMEVANDSTIGIGSDEIDIGRGWYAAVSVRINEIPKQKRITNIISQDAGMIKFELN